MRGTPVVVGVLLLWYCFVKPLGAEDWYLPDGRTMTTMDGSTPPVSGAQRVPYPKQSQVQNGMGQQTPLQVVVPSAPSVAQLQGLLPTGAQESSPPQVQPQSGASQTIVEPSSANSQRVPQLTADEKAQLALVRDTSYSLLLELSPVLKDVNNLRRTYDAVDAILKPAPTVTPGQPLVQVAAWLDLWQIWHPASAIDAFDPNQYSEVLRLVATSLDRSAANIEKRNKTYGYMINGVDDLKIFTATLIDAKAANASSVPDSLVTEDVVKWYVENSAQLAELTFLVGDRPKIQKRAFSGNHVDRGELKTWCYNNKDVVKYYIYGKARLPENLSYLAEK